tara:strand:+ start:28166 stop:29299 length:1134 start_codon:yes stop_codon:yes gene_type:complete
MNTFEKNTIVNTVDVKLGSASYQIFVGPSILQTTGEQLKNIFDKIGHCIIISDENVASLYLDNLEDSLKCANIKCKTFIMPPGEQSKSISQLNIVLEDLINSGLERNTPLIAFGGGVVGDLAGFAASILLRGIPLIQIPTTLLAQVDSAVGGKTGINSKYGKNLIGTFYQPKLVLSDTEVLKSLSERELRAGYAEVVKYGLINDKTFFSWLESHSESLLGGDSEITTKAITFCCNAKAKIVAKDEKERGIRALLNLGHTFAHAFEKEFGFNNSLLHGEAVSLGLILSSQLSYKIGLCPENDVIRIRKHLESVKLPTQAKDLPHTNFNSEKICSHMNKDKKAKNGWPNFVLMNGIGEAEVKSVSFNTVNNLLNEFFTD